MRCELLHRYNRICLVDTDFRLEGLFLRNITTADPLPKELSFLKQEDTEAVKIIHLSHFLNGRISQNIRNQTVRELQMLLNLDRSEFGEADKRALMFHVALLEHLSAEEDDILLSPLQTEYLYFSDFDKRFYQIYRWLPVK